MAPICSTACHFHPCPRSGLVCDRLEECEAAAREVQLAAPALVPVVVPTASADTAAALFVPCPHHSSISQRKDNATILFALARQHGAVRSLLRNPIASSPIRHEHRSCAFFTHRRYHASHCHPSLTITVSLSMSDLEKVHTVHRVQRQRCAQRWRVATTMSRR